MLVDYNVSKLSLDQIDFKSIKIVNTINPHSYCIAKDDFLFKEALLSSDILLPDGIGIVLAERFLNGNKLKKIAGYDLFLFLMNKLNNEHGSVFFLGASNQTLEKIRLKCLVEYPNISFGSYSPPYKNEFSVLDSNIMCENVNSFKPDVLFVGMTAPKQEKWVHVNKGNLNAKTICSIGAVFDFYAENIERAPKFMISLGLEWLHRSFKSSRLFKRNFI
jgi:N-acetylglucosaminyldiphosphoundecaprenol N-acetyl-beta-D-mannosaminyltransferase